MNHRGRPPKPSPRWQDQLTIRQIIRYIREQAEAQGRGPRSGLGYAKIHRAIAVGDLPALEDRLRHDRYGRPLLVVTKADVDAWLNANLRPVMALPISA